jgi:hypothetical protein
MDYTRLALLVTLCLIGVMPRRDHADSEADGQTLADALYLLEEAQQYKLAGDTVSSKRLLRQAQWLIASVVSGSFGTVTYDAGAFRFDYPRDLAVFAQDYERSVIVATSAAVAYKAEASDPVLAPGELAVGVLFADEHFPDGAPDALTVQTALGLVVLLGTHAPGEADDCQALMTLIAETFVTP